MQRSTAKGAGMEKMGTEKEIENLFLFDILHLVLIQFLVYDSLLLVELLHFFFLQLQLLLESKVLTL